MKLKQKQQKYRDKKQAKYQEEYCSKEYCYTFFDGELYGMESDMASLITNHSYHYCYDNTYTQGILLTPDGMVDVGSIFAESSEKTIFSENLLNNTITSVTEKDGNIIVTSVSDPEEIEAIKAEGVQVPKGMVAGLEADMSTDKAFTLYTDAACTRIFNEAPDVNANVTVYIKWVE